MTEWSKEEGLDEEIGHVLLKNTTPLLVKIDTQSYILERNILADR